MKKFILLVAAAGALAVGGAASAQDVVIDGVLYHNPGIAPVEPGAQPYSSTYVDQFGRRIAVDQYGRQVVLQPIMPNRAIIGYDTWGRPIFGTTTYGNYAYNRRRDRDGDGVPNSRDRWPDNPNYR